MLNGPFSPWPSFDEAEVNAVSTVLRSNKVNYWTGHEARDFEKEFAAYIGTDYAIALMNGTVALDVCWQALSLPPGSEVIVTSRTFLASVSSIVLAGLIPVFADVDADTQNISVKTITSLINANTSAILCVHLAGWPCDMAGIMALAEQHNLKVVEDCAQAHGAAIDGQMIGSFGHMAAWSFCQDKIMTTGGEGGMVTTSDKGLWERAWSFKDHGKSFSAVYEKEHPPGFRWVHESFGTNWRMTEIQATIGRLQVRKMPEWTRIRNQYGQQIQQAAQQVGLYVPQIPTNITHAFYKCYVFVNPSNLKPGWDRDRIIHHINELHVPCFSGSCSEVYREKAFDNTSLRPAERLPVAQQLGDTSLMFLCHPTLTQAEIDKTCDAIKAVMQEALA